MPPETPSGEVDAGQFLIVAVPRTGSKLLVEMLDSHPEILCHTEVFNPKSTYLSRKPELSIGTKADRDRRPWRFLRKLYETHAGCKLVGFKIMPSHNNMVLLRLLLSRATRKVILTRKHWLHAYVSNQLALATKQYHVSATANEDIPTERPKAVPVDPAAFLRYLRKVRLYYRLIRLIESWTRQQFFWIDYTEIQNRQVMTRLLRFLGVDENAVLEIRVRKQGSADVAQRIENFSELCDRFRGTSLEHLLTPEAPPS